MDLKKSHPRTFITDATSYHPHDVAAADDLFWDTYSKVLNSAPPSSSAVAAYLISLLFLMTHFFFIT
jgi:hypothetical protein